MGLLDRIQATNGLASQAEMEELLAREVRRQEIMKARDLIVKGAIARFATQEGCDFAEVTRVNGERYFLVDDLVLMLREERVLDKAKAESTEEKEVLWQYIVYLVGVDRTDRVERIRIGVLQLLRFEGILGAHNAGVGRYDFAHERVVQTLYR